MVVASKSVHGIKSMSPAGILRCACGEKIELEKEDFIELSQGELMDAMLDRHAEHASARKQKEG